MNPIEQTSLSKRIACIGVALAVTAASYGFILPLILNQDPENELKLTLAIVTCSLLGAGFLVMLVAFLLFRYSKWKFKMKKLVYTIISLVGRVSCLAALNCAAFLGSCSKLPWLASSSVSFSWTGIVIFFFLLVFSIKDLVLFKQDAEVAAHAAFEGVDQFVNQQQTYDRHESIGAEKEKTSVDDAIEVEVIDKED